jgi:hypothetical protein
MWVRPAEHDVSIGKYFLRPSSPHKCQNPAFWAIPYKTLTVDRAMASCPLLPMHGAQRSQS